MGLICIRLALTNFGGKSQVIIIIIFFFEGLYFTKEKKLFVILYLKFGGKSQVVIIIIIFEGINFTKEKSYLLFCVWNLVGSHKLLLIFFFFFFVWGTLLYKKKVICYFVSEMILYLKVQKPMLPNDVFFFFFFRDFIFEKTLFEKLQY